MLAIHFEGILSPSCQHRTIPLERALTLNDLHTLVENTFSFSKDDIYFVHNGKRLADGAPICHGVVRAFPRLRGGKGGFGSMLRAIGAQIEKTTNREACRDLSGRRLRDINEEKRLKNWISKKADRERENLERKKKKLEKLRSEPKIEFSDKQYEEERSKLTEVVHDAVEKGFQAAMSTPGTSCTVKKPAVKKSFMFEDEDLSDDSSISSSDDCDVTRLPKRKVDSDSDEPIPAKRHLTESGDKDSESSRDSSGDSNHEEANKDLKSNCPEILS